MYKFIPNKLSSHFLDVSTKKFIFVQIFKLGSSYNEIWFTHQTSKPLEIEDEIKITLVIN